MNFESSFHIDLVFISAYVTDIQQMIYTWYVDWVQQSIPVGVYQKIKIKIKSFIDFF
jgi:hypothetical protein